MDLNLLDSLTRDDYAPWRIPGPRDGEIGKLVSGVTSGDAYGRLHVVIRLDTARILTAYAGRAASMAVRLAERKLVERGTVAALLAVGVEDDREIIIVLSLLFRAAELIKIDPIGIFDDMARTMGLPAENIASAFARGDASARSIEAMGFREGRDDDGFRFWSTW